MKFPFLLILFCWNFLFAGLEDHLKKAENKTGDHSMRNIDFVYMINLDKRPEKYSLTSEAFHQYGIYPYRFSAVNGWELSLKNINDVGIKFQPGMTPLLASTYPLSAGGLTSHEYMTEYGKTYFCHCLSRGAIGCALSHISILKDAWESGYETIWVLEDDVEILANPNTISDLIDELDRILGKDNWDVLFTDQDYRSITGGYVVASGSAKRPDMDCSQSARYSLPYTIKEDISLDFKRISARFGTHSMIIRRSGIEKLLEFSKTHSVFLPYDMDNYLAPNLQRYALRYDLVTNMLNSISDNGSPFYEKKTKD